MNRWWAPALALLACGCAGAQASEATKRIDVLFIGNSLTYVNNTPALLDALAAAQPEPIAVHADAIVAPGATMSEHWQAGAAAAQIAGGRWNALVLQERGGLLACLALPERRGETECQASVTAHRKFSELARQHGLRVIVLGTWGPDSIWQGQLSRGLRILAGSIKAEAFDAGVLLRARAKADPSLGLTADAGLHPSLDGSLLLAGGLYQWLTGRSPQPVALELSFPLLPPRAAVAGDALLSQQPQVAGDGSITHVDAARLQALFADLATHQDNPRK